MNSLCQTQNKECREGKGSCCCWNTLRWHLCVPAQIVLYIAFTKARQIAEVQGLPGEGEMAQIRVSIGCDHLSGLSDNPPKYCSTCWVKLQFSRWWCVQFSLLNWSQNIFKTKSSRRSEAAKPLPLFQLGPTTIWHLSSQNFLLQVAKVGFLLLISVFPSSDPTSFPFVLSLNICHPPKLTN